MLQNTSFRHAQCEQFTFDIFVGKIQDSEMPLEQSTYKSVIRHTRRCFIMKLPREAWDLSPWKTLKERIVNKTFVCSPGLFPIATRCWAGGECACVRVTGAGPHKSVLFRLTGTTRK